MDRLKLIRELGKEWRGLLKKYPNSYRGAYSADSEGWRTLAVGVAIAALAEEEYRVGSWRDILPKAKRRKFGKRIEVEPKR